MTNLDEREVTLARAEDCAKGADSHSGLMRQMVNALRLAESELSALRAENERLAWENKSFRISAAPAYADMDVLRSRVARLAEALKRVPCVWHPNTDLCRDGQTCFRCLALRETEGGAK